ncbi:MAG: DUF6513 domain-containing protein [Planctomycetota bacterium]|nr:DUF6513 domain-containing protein [Planctomycetota bacterium]
MNRNHSYSGQTILFVTGRLAQHALRSELKSLALELAFEFEIAVMPITVAALMTPEWIARKLEVPAHVDLVIVPGYCDSGLSALENTLPCPVQAGPRDLRKLSHFFGLSYQQPEQYGEADIEIIAEINHAPRIPLSEIIATGKQLVADGADIVDVGCDPGTTWDGVQDCVKALTDEGIRVSIDSMNPTEIMAAVNGGAELVLSVNASNRHAALDWGVPVVVIPDEPANLQGLEESVEWLAQHNIPLRIDPILEPIGCGFADSLQRYWSTRQRFPDAEMMMGIGNLTELTDSDSAGINMLLLGFCQELSIYSVLTTQVIPWASTSVRECAIARQLVHYAVNQGVPPKHIDQRLITLRDEETTAFGAVELETLAAELKDSNYRLFAERGQIHIVSTQLHLANRDPFKLFEELLNETAKENTADNLDATHSFYLGFEMAKALTALTLDKQYTQDESLDWGYLTQQETNHRLSHEKPNR